jgi:Ser/Thr protein kinase RdoA (MazF antagonist)
LDNCNDAVAGVRRDQLPNFRPLNGVGSKYPTTSSEAYFRSAAAVMTTRPSEVAQDLSARLLASHYGLTGSINVLSSEIERTTEVHLLDGSRLILKTSARPEAIDSFRFQSEALAALEGASGFVTPRIVRTGGGTLMFRDNGVSGYLQTRLVGASLHEAPKASDLLYEAGKALGMLNLALGPVNLPAMHRPILWHIGCWPKLLELEGHLPSGQIAKFVRLAMASFSDFIAPQLGNVAWQVVHNDPSPFNTLVTDDGIGFIDFADGCWGPRIQDLAIAASHVVNDPSLALGGAEHLIAGYASVVPLSHLEASFLVGLMKARQSALILINYWRANLFPEDAPYIKKNVARAEHGLSILESLGGKASAAVLRAISLTG